MKRILFITIWLLTAAAVFAQSNTDKVRQFERLMHEWKSDGYSTGSEKYTQLMSMVTEGCKMSERIAKAYIDDKNASTFDIKAPAWFQYIKENKISISLRDLREESDKDGRRIVYCWIKYTQPDKQDKDDFVGFKFDGGKILYICNDDMERANRIKTDNERNVVDTKPSASEQPQQKSSATSGSGMFDGHEYVDLGLPSGTLWATCNVGANNPWENGDYFAWGETKTYACYDWGFYKYAKGDYNRLTKYCSNSYYGDNGFVDNKLHLDIHDDAAYVIWGVDWSIPTSSQFGELKDNCIWSWTKLNDKEGYLLTGPNKNTLFFPAAGYHWNCILLRDGTDVVYWADEVLQGTSCDGVCLWRDATGKDLWSIDRDHGLPIRAVRRGK